MDAEYLRNTVGQTLAKGCAETIGAAPVDPIQYLSLWLLNYVENTKIESNFWKEKEYLLQEQSKKEEEERQRELQEKEALQKELEALNELRLIQNDPYLLFNTCLQVVSEFTACSSAYIALVLDKLWEPPKKSSEQEEGTQDEEPEEEQEEEEEEEDQEQDGGAEQNADDETKVGQADGDEQAEGTDTDNSQGDNQKKRGKPPKPPDYKKKILLYASVTQENNFLVNKQLNRKLVPITFSVLLQGLPRLHISNVLYQEGIHFFQNLPRMGAYFAVPIHLNTSPVQVVALLCVDSLKKEHFGTGRPFSVKEQELIVSVAQAASEVLTTVTSTISVSYKTKEIMKDLQEHIQEIKASYEAELKRERTAEKAKSSQAVDRDKANVNSNENQNSLRQEGTISNEKDEANTEAEDETNKDDNDASAMHDAGEKDESDSENEEVETAPEPGEEKVEEEEELEEADDEAEHDDMEESEQETQSGDEDGDQKQIHLAEIALKQQQNRVAKLEKNFQKCQTKLTKQGVKVVKLEKRLKKTGSNLQHLHTHLATILDTLTKYKDEELLRIKQYLFPPTIIHRILKALLHVLGHDDATVNEWTRSRQILDDDIVSALKNYSPVSDVDLKVWDMCDIYLEGITEELLSKEAPVGYLGQQWLLAAKKMAIETMRHNNHRREHEKAAKDFADAELEQMVAEIDLRVAIDEEKKRALELDDLQSKFAREMARSSSPADGGAEQGHEEEEEEEEGEPEE